MSSRKLKNIPYNELLIGLVLFTSSILFLFLFIGRFNWITVLPIGVSWIALVLIIDFFDRVFLGTSYPAEEKKVRDDF